MPDFFIMSVNLETATHISLGTITVHYELKSSDIKYHCEFKKTKY